MRCLSAGASDGADVLTWSYMDVAPTAPHQRVPVILGSRDEVAVLDSYHKDAADS